VSLYYKERVISRLCYGIVYELKTLIKEENVLRLNGTLLTKMTTRILTLLLVLMPLTALAETLYVSDMLRIGIRTEPSSNVPSIAVIKSGVAVEVLKRKGSYIRIRTESGIEGWVKGAYFSKKTPSAKKLNSAMKKINKLESEIDTLNKQKNTQAMNNTPELGVKIADLEKTNLLLEKEIKSLKSTPGKIPENKLSVSNINKNLLYIALGALVVLFSIGFLFGVSWHKNQVTKRLGGMSI